MSEARILDCCDAAVAALAALVEAFPATIQRTYVPDVGLTPDEPDTLISGCQVYAFPPSWGSSGAADRISIYQEYTLSFIVIERYTATAGAVPVAWVDAHVLFVESLFNLLKNPTTVLIGNLVNCYRPEDLPAEVNSVYDWDLLKDNKTFCSEFTVTFREIVGSEGS